MKVNFWQILGIVLVIVGVVLVARKRMGRDDTVAPDPSSSPAATMPTTAPLPEPLY